ncbi:MAG: thioesterase family protein [Candidatus Nanopelagicales bacterium]
MTTESRQPSPFRGYQTGVRPDWLDYNGHMNDSAYAVVCTEANEMLLDALGVGAAYRESTGAAMYTVEAHLRYLREVGPDAQLRAETVLIDADAKRLRVHTTVIDQTDAPVLTGEYLFLHMDVRTGKVASFPPDRDAVVKSVLAAHEPLPRPAHIGLGVGAPRPRH